LKTEINGSVTINIPDETNGYSLVMEYLYLKNLQNQSRNLINPIFRHMRVENFTLGVYSTYDNGNMSGAFLANMLIEGLLKDNSVRTCSFTVINSLINRITYSSQAKQCNFINSVIFARVSSEFQYMRYISFKNCIFFNSTGVLDNTNSCDHCLAIVEDGANDVLANMLGTNWTVNNMNEIFVSIEVPSNEDYYRLTPTAAQNYLGTDGTQVGIWGGPMPWTTTAENPTITRCQVAGRSTADGKLSVEIEVSGIQ
jgi:hypothetical protein